jgi:hypothetical protein
MNISPLHLPQVDSIDVVNLKDFDVDRVSEYMQKAIDTDHIKVVGDLAQQIANFWQQLPPGEQFRCHIPPFGLRFYSNGKLQLQASICWECNNIFGDLEGNNFSYEFDGQHQISQALLEICKKVYSSY